MRLPRLTRRRAVGALILAFAAYSGIWLYEARRIRSAFETFLTAREAEGYTIARGAIVTGGFPLSIDLALDHLALSTIPRLPDASIAAGPAVVTVRPWRPATWTLTLPRGLSFDLASPKTPVRVTADRFEAVTVGDYDGGARIAISAETLSGDVAGQQPRVGIVHLDLAWPGRLPDHPDAKNFDFALHLERVGLPFPIGPLGDTVDDLAIGGSMMGPLPRAPLGRALEGWRDAGGTIEIHQASLNWGAVRITADGTASLDNDMQPLAAFSATLRGWSDGLDAIAAMGSLRPEQANFAKMGLSLLSHVAADGASELTTPITLQNGQIYVEKAKVGQLPRLAIP